MIKEQILKHQKGRKKQQKAKLWVNTIDFPSPIKFSKLYLMFEAKIIKLSTLALSEYTGNI